MVQLVSLHRHRGGALKKRKYSIIGRQLTVLGIVKLMGLSDYKEVF